MVKYFIAATFLVIGLFVISTDWAKAAPPLCLDPKGHLIWPGQNANTVPMRSAGAVDALDNSPLTVNNGNVGVGVNPPATRLDVAQSNAIRLGNAYISSGGAQYAHFSGNAWFNGSSWLIPDSSRKSGLLQFGNDEIRFYQTQTAGQSNFINRFIIDGVGNVGINNPNPQTRLDISGDLRADNANLNGNLASNVVRLNPGTAPTNPQQGMMYYDSTSAKFKCFVGTSGWVNCGADAGGQPTGPAFPFQVKDSSGNLVLEVNQE